MQLVDELHRHGMGLILDFVPNHMGIGPDNPWWVDTLEWGRLSPYADFFDIDWEPLEPTLAGKVLLPVLGDHYGAVLTRGELQLRLDAAEGRFAVRYFDDPFPISPHDYPALLLAASDRSDAPAERLEQLVADLRIRLKAGRSARQIAAMRGRVAEWHREFAALLANEPTALKSVQSVLDDLNGVPGQPATFDALHRLLERQAYRLAFWRVAAHEINYRRFFDINDLAGLRMEQPELFEVAHRLVRQWLAEGKIQGIRLDHVDGLRNPNAYFVRLQRLAAAALPTDDADYSTQESKRTRARRQPLYLVVEKILAPHEGLRQDWPVAGTTGYDFMAAVNGLFVDPRGERWLTRFYESIVGRAVDFEDMAVDAKRQIIQDSLGSELNVLANAFNRIAKQSRDTRDFSRTALREALTNVVAHFPVYRTYVTAAGATAPDRRDIEWAVGKARRAARAPDRSIYDFILAVLTLDLEAAGRRKRAVIDAALKFQQYTGPVMAKAMEDTLFYRYVRLVSLNEVGGQPSQFGIRPAAFHDANRRRLREHPFAMLATATHDHKRGEDVRARLNVLSELPREWTGRVRRWEQLNARKRQLLDGERIPSRNDEYLFYQTLVGAWPYDVVAPEFAGMEDFRDRIDAYMRKAAREAKLHTSWASPDEDYERSLSEFVERTLDAKQSRPFLEDISGLIERIAAAGAVNGLAQVLLKLVGPGVPDTYQGMEYWDLSLVDPDNRRPVDYARRQQSLDALQTASCSELLGRWRDGHIKQHVVLRALELRRRLPELFAMGDYDPLQTSGLHADRVVAIARRHADRALLAVVPRLVWPLVEGTQPLPRQWDDAEIQLPADFPRELYDVMSGATLSLTSHGKLPCAQVLERFPVALLIDR